MVWDPRSGSGSDDALAVSMQEAFSSACLASCYTEAVACRELLADYSIPAVLGTSVRNMPGGGVPVLVPEELLDQANDIIACFGEAGDPDEWDDEPLDDDDYDDDDDDDDLDDDFDDDLDHA